MTLRLDDWRLMLLVVSSRNSNRYSLAGGAAVGDAVWPEKWPKCHTMWPIVTVVSYDGWCCIVVWIFCGQIDVWWPMWCCVSNGDHWWFMVLVLVCPMGTTDDFMVLVLVCVQWDHWCCYGVGFLMASPFQDMLLSGSDR